VDTVVSVFRGSCPADRRSIDRFEKRPAAKLRAIVVRANGEDRRGGVVERAHAALAVRSGADVALSFTVAAGAGCRGHHRART